MCNLNEKSVIKEKLIEWLETLCCLLDSFSDPLLWTDWGAAGGKNIDDQAKILEHLRDLTLRGDRELKAVHVTVQTEMKNNSSNVAESCSAA